MIGGREKKIFTVSRRGEHIKLSREKICGNPQVINSNRTDFVKKDKWEGAGMGERGGRGEEKITRA